MTSNVVLLVLLVGIFSLVHGLPDELYRSEFTSWMTKHGKSYSTVEFLTKFATFKSNYDFIQSHNAGGHSFQVGLNSVSDLTAEEYRTQYLTLKRSVPIAKQGSTGVAELATSPTSSGQQTEGSAPAQQRSARAAPASIDWQALGAVTAVKDQGQCGCCWAFSTTAAIEGINKIKTGRLMNYSSQNVLDCTGSSSSCDGGYIGAALTAVASSGIANLTTYPAYTQSKGSCRYTASMKAGSVRAVSYPLANSEDGLAAQILVQPIVISFDASGQAFQLYKSGIYRSTTCSSATTNHAMLLVGYGTDSTGAQYWRVKNQWGTLWGNNGYIQVARGSNMCGIASDSVYPTLDVPATTFYAFNDAFVNGFQLTTSGAVTNLNTASSTAYKGTYSISATLAPKSLLFLNLPAGSLGYRYVKFTMRTATAGGKLQVTPSYNGGWTWPWNFVSNAANTWYSSSIDLSAPSSICQILFNNTGTVTTTYFLDELYLM